MEELKNLTIEDIKEVIKDFPYEPLFNKVVITLNKEEVIGLDISEDSLSETQYIIAGTFKFGETIVGPGDKVLIDLKSLQVNVRQESGNAYENVKQIEIDPVFIDGRMYTIINDRGIKAKYKK